jgi:hypothetical protein
MLETIKLVLHVVSAVAGAWFAVDHRIDTIELQLVEIKTTLKLQDKGK